MLEESNILEATTNTSSDTNVPMEQPLSDLDAIRSEIRKGVQEIKGFVLGAATAILVGILFFVLLLRFQPF